MQENTVPGLPDPSTTPQYQGGQAANPWWYKGGHDLESMLGFGGQHSMGYGTGGVGSSGGGMGGMGGAMGGGMGEGIGLSQMLGGLISSFGHGGVGAPYEAAEGQLNKIPGYVNQYLAPVQHGYTQDFQHPTQIMDQIGSHFHSDPGYQFDMSQELGAANRSAAAGGQLGTPASQQEAQTVASGLASQHYQQYMHNALGLHEQGLGGAGQIGGEMTNDLSNYAAQLAQLEGQRSAAGAKQRGMMGALGPVGGLLSDIF